MLSIHQVKKGLADGVLDNQGDYDTYNLRDRRQHFIKRLQQVMDVKLPPERPASPANRLPPDRAMGLINAAIDQFGKDIAWAEEQYAENAERPVILITAQKHIDAAKLAAKLKPLQNRYFGDDIAESDRPDLEVIDTTTFEALKRLEQHGLISSHLQSKRLLCPMDPEKASDTVSRQDQKRLDNWNGQLKRKIKTTHVLINANLIDETRPAVMDILLLTARICALKSRLPQPRSLDSLAELAHHQQIKKLTNSQEQLSDWTVPNVHTVIRTCESILSGISFYC